MNDRWTDIALGIAEGATAELAAVLASLAALPLPAPARAALAACAGDLRHQVAAARALLDAYGLPAEGRAA